MAVCRRAGSLSCSGRCSGQLALEPLSALRQEGTQSVFSRHDQRARAQHRHPGRAGCSPSAPLHAGLSDRWRVSSTPRSNRRNECSRLSSPFSSSLDEFFEFPQGVLEVRDNCLLLWFLLPRSCIPFRPRPRLTLYSAKNTTFGLGWPRAIVAVAVVADPSELVRARAVTL